MRWNWLWLVTAGLVAAASGCTGTKAKVTPAELDGRVSIEVMPAQRGTIREKGNYYGELEARRSLLVSAEVGGIAFEVPPEEGDIVKGGDLLIQIDAEPFRLAEEQAIQSLAAAQIRIDQVEQTIALEEAQLEAGLAQARAAVDMAQARLALVEKGARTEEKRQLKAVLDGAEAGMENAELQLARVKALVAAGASTQQLLDTAETGFKTAVAGYNQALQGYHLIRRGARDEDKDAARAAVRQAQAGFEAALASMESLAIRERELDAVIIQVAQAELALERARLQLRKTRITAPLDAGQEAIVHMRNIDEGEMVAPGVPKFELLIVDQPRLVFQISGMDIGHFAAGKTMDVTCHGDKVAVREGTVAMVGTRGDPRNGTFPVKVKLDNRDRGLRMGMICEVKPELTRLQGILVPRDAVLDTQGGKVVLVEKDGVVRQKNVTVLGIQEGIAAVSAGLEEGDRVIVVGTRLVKDGDDIVVRGERPSIRKVGDIIYEH